MEELNPEKLLQEVEYNPLVAHPLVRSIVYIVLMGIPLFFVLFHHIPTEHQTHITEWIKAFIANGS